MAEKKKILYIVEAMGGGVFTYIVDFTKLFTSDTPEMIRKRLEEHRPKNFRGRPWLPL